MRNIKFHGYIMAAAAGVMMLVTHGILLTVGVFLQPIAQTTGIPFAQVY